ncbi:TPA: DNA repair and recombination protein RadA [Candidatus Micrarchaeota archaeon]|nr:DNA repair and recombination protein RadA [Candidatus Micrarchaeota archaeon]
MPVNYTVEKLEDLPGVGSATLSKLKEAGIESLEDLEGLDVDDLIDIGLSKATAKKVLQAFYKSREIPVMTGADIEHTEKEKRYLKTHTELDDLLGGGFKESYLYEFYGQFATGKSEIGHTIAVRAQLPEEHGGLEGKVIFIDTENTFSPKRIREIGSYVIKQHGLSGHPDQFLDNIFVARTFTSADLYSFVTTALPRLVRENPDVRLIIIDSVTAPFRAEYTDLNELPKRQKKIGEILMKLHEIAVGMFDGNYRVVYYTNQVATRIGPFVNPAASGTHVGGNILGHRAQYRVYLRKSRDNIRIARLVDAHDLPAQEVLFKIGPGGILPVKQKSS